MKKSKQVITTTRTFPLEEGHSLADVLKSVMDSGVTDLSKVKLKWDYVGCQCDHGDSYCYCPSSYTDIHFAWEV